MKISDRQFNQFVLAGIVLGFVTLVAGVSAATWGFIRNQEIGRLVSHTYEVELALSNLAGWTERIENARRGYLIDDDERFLRSRQRATTEIGKLVQHVSELTADNPSQVASLESMRADLALQAEEIERSFQSRQTEGAAIAQSSFVREGDADVVRRIRTTAENMMAEERRLLAERRGQQQASATIAFVVLGLSGLVLVIVAGGTIWAVRRNLSDVTRARDTLRDLADNLEAAVADRTADLQRANDEIQRFAYIVSHDLRSPLVNVMGFTSELDAATKPLSDLIERAELEAPQIVTEDARLAVREDLPEAIGFIRSSTQKMDRLINAILRLSREGRRVITPESLDVGEMMEGIVGSLQHRLSEVGAEVTIEGRLPGLISDRVAVEQIFSNLVENAVKYLKPGRPGRIRVRGRSEAGRLVYEFEDNGRGIDPKDHERIFDLFRRSGTQDQPGEGIGLAHVRALAYRLGGTVSCRSSLDDGATFIVSMPKIFKASKERAA